MCKLADIIFMEKEGIVSLNLQRRRKPKSKAPYEKPKQEVLA